MVFEKFVPNKKGFINQADTAITSVSSNLNNYSNDNIINNNNFKTSRETISNTTRYSKLNNLLFNIDKNPSFLSINTVKTNNNNLSLILSSSNNNIIRNKVIANIRTTIRVLIIVTRITIRRRKIIRIINNT